MFSFGTPMFGAPMGILQSPITSYPAMPSPSSYYPTTSYYSSPSPLSATTSYSSPLATTTSYSSPLATTTSYSSNPVAATTSYSSPFETTTYSAPTTTTSYSNPLATTTSYSSPAVATTSYSSPITTSYSSPMATTSYSSPLETTTTYSSTPVATTSYSSPLETTTTTYSSAPMATTSYSSPLEATTTTYSSTPMATTSYSSGVSYPEAYPATPSYLSPFPYSSQFSFPTVTTTTTYPPGFSPSPTYDFQVPSAVSFPSFDSGFPAASSMFLPPLPVTTTTIYPPGFPASSSMPFPGFPGMSGAHFGDNAMSVISVPPAETRSGTSSVTPAAETANSVPPAGDAQPTLPSSIPQYQPIPIPGMFGDQFAFPAPLPPFPGTLPAFPDSLPPTHSVPSLPPLVDPGFQRSSIPLGSQPPAIGSSIPPTTTGEKKVIVVVGATGAQGGGLVQSILEDPNGPFRVRAVTRDVNSEKARELAQKGAEVVAASIDDEASMEAALHGAYGAFFVTFYWDHFSPEKEVSQAKTLAQAAKNAGVQHVVWSTLEDTRTWVPLSDPRMPTLMGKYKVPHFDAKGESNKFFTESGVPTTFLIVSFYWDNLVTFGMGPKRGPDGKLVFTLPMGDKKMPGIASVDIGRCAYGIFKKGQEYIGKTVGVAGEHLTGQEMADALTTALGEEVTYNAVPPAVYRSYGFPGAEDLGNMFQFYADCDHVVCAIRNVTHSRILNPQLQTFTQFLAEHKDRIPLE